MHQRWFLDGMPMLPWVGWIVMLIFWIVVVVGIVLLVTRLSPRKGPPGPSQKTPLDIAKERYARGEITREEFEQMKRDLE